MNSDDFEKRMRSHEYFHRVALLTWSLGGVAP